ncbi:MAG: hypothetical protein ACR2J8_13925, partial [Thermomicrobiales bacterium]
PSTMAVGTYAGLITKRASIGTQQIATPGLRPVAIVLFGFGATVSMSRPSVRGSAAFLVAAPGGQLQTLGRSGAIRDGALEGDTAGSGANALVVPAVTAAGTGNPVASATLSRVFDGGFDLTWTQNDGGTEQFAILAIGGDVQAWTTRTALPRATGPFSIAGAPFAPKLALVLPDQPGGANLGIGAVSAGSVTAQWGLSTFSPAGADPTQSTTRLVSGSLLACTDGVGKVLAQAQVTGFTANGMTLRATTAAPTAGYGAQVLLIGGPDLVALTGTLAKPVSPGAVSLSGVTWRPLGLLAAGGRGVAANASTPGVAIGIGVAADDGVSPSGAGSAGAADRDGSATAIAASLVSPSAWVRPGPASGAPGASSPVVRADATFAEYGGTLTFGATDTVAERVAFLVIGGTRRGELLAGGGVGAARFTVASAQLGQFPLLGAVARPAIAAALFTAPPAPLALAPVLGGAASASFTTAGAIGFAQPLDGSATAAFRAAVPRLGSAQPLQSAAAMKVAASAAGRLIVPWPLTGTIGAAFGASGFLRLVLPDLLPA